MMIKQRIKNAKRLLTALSIVIISCFGFAPHVLAAGSALVTAEASASTGAPNTAVSYSLYITSAGANVISLAVDVTIPAQLSFVNFDGAGSAFAFTFPAPGTDSPGTTHTTINFGMAPPGKAPGKYYFGKINATTTSTTGTGTFALSNPIVADQTGDPMAATAQGASITVSGGSGGGGGTTTPPAGGGGGSTTPPTGSTSGGGSSTTTSTSKSKSVATIPSPTNQNQPTPIPMTELVPASTTTNTGSSSTKVTKLPKSASTSAAIGAIVIGSLALLSWGAYHVAAISKKRKYMTQHGMSNYSTTPPPDVNPLNPDEGIGPGMVKPTSPPTTTPTPPASGTPPTQPPDTTKKP